MLQKATKRAMAVITASSSFEKWPKVPWLRLFWWILLLDSSTETKGQLAIEHVDVAFSEEALLSFPK